MVQTSRPDADDGADGNWTDQGGGTSLYAAIDDPVGSPDDETTYIKVTDTSSSEVCIVQLASISAPESGNVTIKWRATTSDNMTAGAPQLKIELLADGSTTAKDGTGNQAINDAGTWTSYSYPSSGSLDVSGVSDWSTLKFRITMIAGSGGGMGANDIMKVTQAYLETPDAAAGSSIAPIAMNHYRRRRGN